MVPAAGAGSFSSRSRMQRDIDPHDPDVPGSSVSAGFAARRLDETFNPVDEDSDDDPSPGATSRLSDQEEGYDDDDLDDQFPLGDGVAETVAEVWCPYCGEPSEINVDPSGGSLQNYVEDCPVCCRPWQVTVHFSFDGSVTVACDADDASMDDLD